MSLLFYETFRKGKSLETEDRLAVARDHGEGVGRDSWQTHSLFRAMKVSWD